MSRSQETTVIRSGSDRSRADAPLAARTQMSPVKPCLLVSVRDRDEFDLAVRSGTDIVDLKEPRQGPLAPAGIELWTHAATSADRFRDQSTKPTLSAALGERSDAMAVASHLPCEFSYAKVGPSGCSSPQQLNELWADTRALLDDRIELVAVAYADSQNAGCEPPESVLRTALACGFNRCLIDTFTKDGRSTLDHLGFERLSRLGQIASEGGLWWALAGSMNASSLRALREQGISPDCVGVRGDVCEGGRTGALSGDRIRLWQKVTSIQ